MDRFIVVLLILIGGPSFHPDGAQNLENCVAIPPQTTVNQGETFRLSLPGDLELRLYAGGPWGWNISVGPKEGPALNFVEPVSPPYQSRPHLQFGAGYGLTARESAGFERDLRFVLNFLDYQAASKIAQTERAGPEKTRRLDLLARGTLRLQVIDSKIRDDVRVDTDLVIDTLEWIRLAGRACVQL